MNGISSSDHRSAGDQPTCCISSTAFYPRVELGDTGRGTTVVDRDRGVKYLEPAIFRLLCMFQYNSRSRQNLRGQWILDNIM